MLGYRLNPQTTADTFTADGYIRSGDIGAFNNGKWYICDRKKDIIKVRGWQVSPTEIEAALLEHPDIIDAAVIGLPAEDGLSEVPRAYVVRSPTSGIGEDAVKLFLKARLARYKEVGRVIFVASVPRNPTGKILRRLLREAEGHDQKPADGVGLNQDRPALCEVLQDALEKLSSSPKVH